jgi:hypothetical protein
LAGCISKSVSGCSNVDNVDKVDKGTGPMGIGGGGGDSHPLKANISKKIIRPRLGTNRDRIFGPQLSREKKK